MRLYTEAKGSNPISALKFQCFGHSQLFHTLTTNNAFFIVSHPDVDWPLTEVLYRLILIYHLFSCIQDEQQLQSSKCGLCYHDIFSSLQLHRTSAHKILVRMLERALNQWAGLDMNADVQSDSKE